MDIFHELLALTQFGNAIHIGAHPDDEDTGLISYLVNKYGMRVFYWSATRGEKGQNYVNKCHDVELGVLRTWESLDAAQINNSECLFGPFIDFGFTKTLESAFTYWNNVNSLQEIDWNKELVTREIVRVIRKYKPLIVISRWSGTPQDFHGHHQAVGVATLKAFELAGNPTYFHELANEGIFPWQPLKLYISKDNSTGIHLFGGALNFEGKHNPQYEEQSHILALNTGELELQSKMTYQQRAWQAYSKHCSQAMAQFPFLGDFMYYFELVKDYTGGGKDFLQGIDPSLPGLAQLIGIQEEDLMALFIQNQKLCNEAYRTYLRNDPQDAARQLLDWLKEVRKFYPLINRQTLNPSQKSALYCYLDHKLKKVQEVICELLDVKFEAYIDSLYLVQGTENSVSLQLLSHGETPIGSVKFSLKVPPSITSMPRKNFDFKLSLNNPKTITSAKLFRQDYQLFTGYSKIKTEPYWLAKPNNGRLYTWDNPEVAGRALSKPLFTAACHFSLFDIPLALDSPLSFHEAKGHRIRVITPLQIPAIYIQGNLDQISCRSEEYEQKVTITVQVRRNSKLPETIFCKLSLKHEDIFQVEPLEENIELERYGETRSIEFTVTIPPNINPGKYVFRHECYFGSIVYDSIISLVMQGPEGMQLPLLPDESNCIKHTLIQKPAVVNLNILSINFAKGLRYAYVPGEYFDLPLLFQLKEFNTVKISDEDFRDPKLDQFLGQFDAIIIGANAYHLRHSLRRNNAYLLDYVRRGGTLIVFYQKYIYAENYAPYPFKYGMPHDRITRADRPVRILEPEHFIFNSPNKIHVSDFDNWKVDRGSYFWREWDKAYIPLLACSDVGEPEQLGGMLYTHYGMGAYVYMGYSLFRQIPLGIPGAIRIFANLLAIPKKFLEERAQFLQSTPIFYELTAEDLEKVARIIREHSFSPGEYICHQNDFGSELFILRSGVVEAVKEEKGKSAKVAEFLPGSCFGELAVLGNIPRTASIIAKTPASILAFESKDFQKLMVEHPSITRGIIRELIKKFTGLS